MSTNSHHSERQKNSPSTKLVNSVTKRLGWSLFWRIAIYMFAFALVTILAYNRYPTYWDAPNFYAEDGTVFAQNIIDKGFLGGLLTPFNGYFVFGIYVLEGFAFLMNHLVWGGNVLDLPQALGAVSYLFWAFLCTLPLLLFWNSVRNKVLLLFAAVSMAMLPFPGFNYAVFTVGNLKFAFLFIAFVLLIKRAQLAATSKWVYLIDICLVLCAFTNVTVYLLLPYALLRYWPGVKKLTKTYCKQLLHNASFQSLLGLLILVSIQIMYVVFRGGVDDTPGYLQEPYELGKTIEIFFQRTLLYPFDHVIMKHLTDTIVVALLAGLVAFIWKIARREDRKIVLFGFYTALASGALFVSQRPGVSRFYSHYSSTGPDNFFYAQNLVILFTVLYVLIRRYDLIKQKYVRLLAILLLCLVPLSYFMHNDIGANALASRSTGTFRYAAQQACKTTRDDPVKAAVYPVSIDTFELKRSTYCTSDLRDYVPPREPLPLAPFGGNYLAVTDVPVTQTFTAHYDGLSGISLFLSTFAQASNSSYALKLMDKTCHTTLRSAPFTSAAIADNTYVDIGFRPIVHSKNNSYCFTVEAKKIGENKPPLAYQFGEPNIYKDGVATKEGVDLPEDLVFDILYR